MPDAPSRSRKTGRNVLEALTTPMNTESTWTRRQLAAWSEATLRPHSPSRPRRNAIATSDGSTIASATAAIADDVARHASIDRRTLIIFGGYAVAFAVVAIVNVLGLPPLVRFAFAVVALAVRRGRGRARPPSGSPIA